MSYRGITKVSSVYLKRGIKSVIKIVKILAGLLLLSGFVVYSVDVVKNHDILQHQIDLLGHLNHPKKSVLLSEKYALGLLSGNGNHCDFFAGQLREYDLAKSEVISHYKALDKEISILFIDKGRIPEARLPDKFKDLRAWGLTKDRVNEPMYMVYRFKTMKANKDIRCH